jgi:hypothetical protein
LLLAPLVLWQLLVFEVFVVLLLQDLAPHDLVLLLPLVILLAFAPQPDSLLTFFVFFLPNITSPFM